LGFSAKKHPFKNPIKVEKDNALFLYYIKRIKLCMQERKREKKSMFGQGTRMGNTDGSADREITDGRGDTTHSMQIWIQRRDKSPRKQDKGDNQRNQ